MECQQNMHFNKNFNRVLVLDTNKQTSSQVLKPDLSSKQTLCLWEATDEFHLL